MCNETKWIYNTWRKFRTSSTIFWLYFLFGVGGGGAEEGVDVEGSFEGLDDGEEGVANTLSNPSCKKMLGLILFILSKSNPNRHPKVPNHGFLNQNHITI